MAVDMTHTDIELIKTAGMQPWGYQSYGGTMVKEGKWSSGGMESIALLRFRGVPQESLYCFLAEAKMDEVEAENNWRRWMQEQRP